MGGQRWCGVLVIYMTLCHVFAKHYDCPKGWHQVRHACYKAFRSDDRQFGTVFHAQVKCRKHGAHLASIPSRVIEEEVVSYVGSLKHRPSFVYFGLNDMRQEGHYEWPDGSKANYTNWASDQPDNPNTRIINENCTTLRSRDSLWGIAKVEWHDFHCCTSNGISTVLCQKAKNPSKRLNDTVLDALAATLLKQCPKEMFNCVVANVPRVRNAKHGKQMSSLVPMGESIEIKCNHGHTFGGTNRSRTLQCFAEGWQPEIEDDCRAQRCIPHPSWRGLIANETKPDFIPDDVIEYTCKDNFTFDDGSTYKVSRCDWDETWVPPLDDCLAAMAEAQRFVARKRDKPSEEAKGSFAIGTCAIIFISVELGMMVFSDLQSIRLHLIYMGHNLQSRFRRKS